MLLESAHAESSGIVFQDHTRYECARAGVGVSSLD